MAKTETKKVPKTKKTPALPSKKTMNFVHHESSFNPKKVLPLAIVVVLVAGLFAKFGIMDQLDKKTAAYNDLAMRQEQLAAVNNKLADYDELAK